jgi:dihydromethanopterin reductase (acceptor)
MEKSMDVAIAWCITGGGAHLRSSVDVMQRVKALLDLKITVFITRWGLDVARIFGVLPKINTIASGKYYEEILVGDYGMYYIGRMNMKRYRLLVIAPATANTIAKMAHGIADNIASALYSQAIKSGVSTVILPTDIPNSEGFIETETPCYIDREVCLKMDCGRCLAEDICPVKAIKRVDGVLRIDLSRCIGCEKCLYSCPYKAVKCWEKIRLLPREIDLDNIDVVKKERNVYIVSDTQQLFNTIKNLVGFGI